MSDSQQMNDEIRRRAGHAPPTPEAPPTASGTPPGNAGAGTGALYPRWRLTMNDIIRMLGKHLDF